MCNSQLASGHESSPPNLMQHSFRKAELLNAISSLQSRHCRQAEWNPCGSKRNSISFLSSWQPHVGYLQDTRHRQLQLAVNCTLLSLSYDHFTGKLCNTCMETWYGMYGNTSIAIQLDLFPSAWSCLHAVYLVRIRVSHQYCCLQGLCAPRYCYACLPYGLLTQAELQCSCCHNPHCAGKLHQPPDHHQPLEGVPRMTHDQDCCLRAVRDAEPLCPSSWACSDTDLAC